MAVGNIPPNMPSCRLVGIALLKNRSETKPGFVDRTRVKLRLLRNVLRTSICRLDAKPAR